MKIEILKEKVLESIKFSGIAFLISFFGAIAGSEGTSKDWRRLGIPLVLLPCAIYSTMSIWSLFILVQHFVFRLGHGIPTFIKDFEDDGSLLGRFFYYTLGKNELLANIFTRGTIALLLCLTFIFIPVLKGNWFEYFYCSAGIILAFALLIWRNLGVYTFTIKGKKYYCCKSDVLVFGIYGMLALKIIF